MLVLIDTVYFFTCAVSFYYKSQVKHDFLHINVINILPMHHRLAAFIFILYNVPMQFIL